MRLTRLDQLDRLIGPTARAVAWWPLVIGGVAALGLLELIGRRPAGAEVDQLVTGLRFAMLAVALSVAFVLDDPTEETVCAVPLPLALRRCLRLAVVLPVLTGTWIGLVAYAHADSGLVESLPVAALTLELAALLAVAFAVAALSSGVAAGPAVLVVVVVGGFVLPPSLRLFASYGDPAMWATAHRRWALILAVALAMLAAANRDPGRPHRRTHPRRRSEERVRQPAAGPLNAGVRRQPTTVPTDAQQAAGR